MKISQSTVSKTLGRSDDAAPTPGSKADVKRHRQARYPKLEEALYEWVVSNQEDVNITGELIKEKAEISMKILHPGCVMRFSNGWLENLKK